MIRIGSILFFAVATFAADPALITAVNQQLAAGVRDTSAIVRRLDECVTEGSSNVVTITTNTVVKDAGLWQLEQLYAGTLAKYGGSEQGNFAVNMQQLLAAKAAATNADQKADIVADGALIGQLYQYLKDANAAFDGLPPGTVTGITTNTTVDSWCAQKRWQSLGLDHLPTGSEVEDAQR